MPWWQGGNCAPHARFEHLLGPRSPLGHLLLPASDAETHGSDGLCRRGFVSWRFSMTSLATHLTTFLREYLPRIRACSVHTCDAYAYSFQLLLCFAAERYGVSPSALVLEQLDAALVLAFLEHLE